MEFIKMSEEKKIGAKFKEFLAKEAKTENGVTSITLGQLKEFGKAEGVTEGVLKQVTEFENEYANGALQYATDKLAEAITEAKKDGESEDTIKNLTHTVKIALPTGKREIRVTACKEFSNPANRDEKVERFAHILDVTKITRAIDKEVQKSEEERIKKLLGLN